MKNRLKVILLLFGFSIALNSFSKTPVLKFKDHKFKIVQFTDLHWINDLQHQIKNDSTIMLMKNLISSEMPDLIVFTGDIVVSNGAADAWKRIMQPMIEYKVPFAITFGNHDTETDIPKKEIFKIIQENPYNMTYDANKSIAGLGNCTLPIKSSDNRTNKWIIYLFDSHAYSQDTLRSKGYDWIKNNQIQWYRENSKVYTRINNNPISSLAFFHIPLPEFEMVRNKKATVGNTSEAVCSPSLNSGLFASFVEMKDVIGVFVGHDHNDDFVGTSNNICLGYGRKTGYTSAYHEILDRGARVIILDENEKKFYTYIRTLTNKCFEFTFKQF